MSSSNNTWAGIGSSSTKSNNASADPKVKVGVGGGATSNLASAKGLLLAQWDFSQMADRSFTTDGVYAVAPTSGQATSANWRFADLATGLGATGKIRIASGRLEMKCITTATTSIWGLNGTRTIRAANFAIDLRTLSQTLSSDPGLASHKYTCEVEMEPTFANGDPAQPTVPTYQQLNYGFVTEMDPLVAGTATQGRHMNMSHFVRTGATSSTHTWGHWERRNYNVTSGEGTSGASYYPSRYSNAAGAGANGYAAAWTVTSPIRTVVYHDGIRPTISWAPSTTSLLLHTQAPNNLFHMDRNINTDATVAPYYNQSSTNDLWAFFVISRTLSTGSTTGEYKIKKISIYEQRI
jgi:hypothetical protein